MSKEQSPSPSKRREQICEEIAGITTMRRGNFNEFYYEQKRKDGTTARRGPFYNVTFKGEKGKTISKSVPKKEADRIRREVENYHKFRKLADEYVDVCEMLGAMGDGAGEDGDAVK
jgi:hypothetical protein